VSLESLNVASSSDSRLARLFATPTSLDRLARADHPKGGMIRTCTEFLRRAHGVGVQSADAVAFFVPGRIEVLGKHTDYCGGRSLLCAIDRGFVIVATPRNDAQMSVGSVATGESTTFPITPTLVPWQGHWSNYPQTVARRLASNFGPELKGVDIAFASDLPQAAGLSSSSAFIVGVFLAVASINRLNDDARFKGSIQSLEDLAHYCGCIENGSGFRSLTGNTGVGTTGGSQDHTAILCCKADTLSQFGFAPVVHEHDVALPADLQLVVLNSGIIAEKTGSAQEKYNAVSRKARHLVHLWNRSACDNKPTLASIVRSGVDASAKLHAIIDAAKSVEFVANDLHDRLDQFIDESEVIIPAATSALADDNLDLFGRLIARSTAGAIEQLRNQVPQTVELVNHVMKHGAIAASPFGAGFGGSVWALFCETNVLQTSLHTIFRMTPSSGVESLGDGQANE
jgi:galactokinase